MEEFLKKSTDKFLKILTEPCVAEFFKHSNVFLAFLGRFFEGIVGGFFQKYMEAFLNLSFEKFWRNLSKNFLSNPSSISEEIQGRISEVIHVRFLNPSRNVGRLASRRQFTIESQKRFFQNL